MRTRLPAAALTALLVRSTLGQAAPVRGPVVAAEQVAPAPIGPGVEVKRRRLEANLLAPVPARVFGGMFLLRADVFAERRELSGPAAVGQPEDLARPATAGIGALFLPHAAEGAPRFFAGASRYGELAFKDDARPMSEYLLGADVADEDMPSALQLKLSPTDEASTRVMLRFRRFPGFNRWLLQVGHRIVTTEGFGIDVQIPLHVIVSWHVPDAVESWKVYGGVRWTSREYPFDVEGGASGWVDGYATSRLVGVRRHLAGPVYLAVEGGMQDERWTLIDERGETRGEHRAPYAWFGRAAVETWIKTP